jgi:hypothetical protein
MSHTRKKLPSTTFEKLRAGLDGALAFPSTVFREGILLSRPC